MSRKTPELTFSSQSGSEVLDRYEKPIPVAELRVGQYVVCPSLFGYQEAVVAYVDGDTAIAESPGLFFPFFIKDGHWWCDHSINKECAKELSKALADLKAFDAKG